MFAVGLGVLGRSNIGPFACRHFGLSAKSVTKLPRVANCARYQLGAKPSFFLGSDHGLKLNKSKLFYVKTFTRRCSTFGDGNQKLSRYERYRLWMIEWGAKARAFVTPEKQHYILHLGGTCALIGIASEDMLTLRTFLVTSGLFQTFAAFTQPTANLVAMFWSLVIMSVHGEQIYKLLIERRHIEFDDDEHELYTRAFLPYGFTPRTFNLLLRNGDAEWLKFKKGENIVVQGHSVQNAYYLMQGTVELNRNGKPVNRIVPRKTVRGKNRKGEWIGQVWDRDYDFTKAHRWSVTAEALEDVVVVKFNLKGFHDTITQDPVRAIAADKMIVRDLWGKLKHTTSLMKGTYAKKKQKIRMLKDELEAAVFDSYLAMIRLATSDGVLTEQEVCEIEIYRRKHGITEEQHQEALNIIGWNLPFKPTDHVYCEITIVD